MSSGNICSVLQEVKLLLSSSLHQLRSLGKPFLGHCCSLCNFSSNFIAFNVISIYMNNTQRYLSHISICLSDISAWLAHHCLKLNMAKIELCLSSRTRGAQGGLHEKSYQVKSTGLNILLKQKKASKQYYFQVLAGNLKSRRLVGPALCMLSISVNNISLCPVEQVHCLAFVFDASLSFTPYRQSVTKSFCFIPYNITTYNPSPQFLQQHLLMSVL